LKALYQDGKKLWTAKANRIAKRAWITEKAIRGNDELTRPKSPITLKRFPTMCTTPAALASENPRLRADPFIDFANVKESPANAMNATRANTSSAI